MAQPHWEGLHLPPGEGADVCLPAKAQSQMLVSVLGPEWDAQESPALTDQSCQDHQPPSLAWSLLTAAFVSALWNSSYGQNLHAHLLKDTNDKEVKIGAPTTQQDIGSARTGAPPSATSPAWIQDHLLTAGLVRNESASYQ